MFQDDARDSKLLLFETFWFYRGARAPKNVQFNYLDNLVTM